MIHFIHCAEPLYLLNCFHVFISLSKIQILHPKRAIGGTL